ncbi:MAG: hypothetical protein P1V35_16085, partial [Planctomycetota bacterium]|nr:hypothetical protein [Planctomycetota bacterium]
MDFSPLGTRWEAASPSEVLLVGIPHENSSAPDIAWLDDAGTTPLADLSRLASESTPWVNEQISGLSGYQSKRAFAKADLDADGRHETTSFRYEDGFLKIQSWEDTLEVPNIQSAPASVTTMLDSVMGVTSVALATGDFDGDTFDELMVGYTTDIEATIEVYKYDGFDFVLVPDSTRVISPELFGSDFSLVIATGNHDQDQGLESVVILNEEMDDLEDSTCQYYVYDDGNEAYAPLYEGSITHSSESAKVASATFADIDGDGLDELAFAGLTEFSDHDCSPTRIIVSAYDDLANGNYLLGSRGVVTDWQSCNNGGFEVEFAHIVAADIDADHKDEIVVNQHIFELDLEGGSVWRDKVDDMNNVVQLPESAFFVNPNTPAFTRGTSAMAKGDVLVNGKEQILIFRQEANSGVDVYGEYLNPSQDVVFGALGAIDTGWGASPEHSSNPIVVPMDTDEDGITMVREDVAHELVFTEPIVIAVLAAPPSVAGIAQNYDACTTTFGNTEFTGSAAEASLTTSASVSVGIKTDIPFVSSGVEFKASATAAATASAGTQYTLSQTIEYTTGVWEDTVIFSCIPMDRFVYRIVRHTDPDMLNAVVTVDLPRT